MEDRDIIKIDEDIENRIDQSFNNKDKSIFSSGLEREINKEIILNTNGVFSSTDNQINLSDYLDNDNYFGRINSALNVLNVDEDSNNKSYQEMVMERNNKDNTLEIREMRNDITSENVIPTKDSLMRIYSQDSTTIKKTSIFQSFIHEESKRNFSYFTVNEKCDVKEIIGYHKLYEIQFFDIDQILSREEKHIKCFRRYDNFDKFNNKLKRMYPYMVMPRLTPKNPLFKILKPDADFYENRRVQLNFFLNYIFRSESLGKTKEFLKFVNDSEFDDDFYDRHTNEINESNFPESFKIIDTVSNKIYGVFSGIFGAKEERKLSNDEILLRRMETHYKGICEKYKEIKANIVNYTKTIKQNAEGYRSLSNTCFYMKDSLPDVEQSKDNFKILNVVSEDISNIYRKFIPSALSLESKFEAFISILSGLCDTFDRYNDFIKIFENVIKAHKHAKANLIENLFVYNEECGRCEKVKQKFEISLLLEVKKFVEYYNNTFGELLDEFKQLVKSINTDVKSANCIVNTDFKL